MLTEKQIIFSYSNLREKPNSKSNLETQCLFGEKVFILKQEKKWSFVETQLDKYKGWIKNETLGDTFESNFLNDLNTIVYESPDLKSKSLFNLFLGSKVNLNKNWMV